MEWIMVDMYCTFFPNKEFKGNSRGRLSKNFKKTLC